MKAGITQTPSALTLRSDKVLTSVRTFCAVSTCDKSAKQPSRVDNIVAIWDSGATASCISNEVATRLGLIACGHADITLALVASVVPYHRVDLELPNGLRFEKLWVFECDLRSDDVLIGMDIISQGDFAITTAGGRTTFSFRKPAVEEIDFVTVK
jgi:hypothetical protein